MPRVLALGLFSAAVIWALPGAAQTARFPDPEPARPAAAPRPAPPPAPAAAPPKGAPAPALAPTWQAPAAPLPPVRVASTEAPMLAPQPAPSALWGAPPAAERDGAGPDQGSGSSTTLVVGALALAIPYATGIGIAASESFDNGSGWLAVPALGPWLALSARRDPCESLEDQLQFDSEVGRCVAEPIVRGMLVLDGVVQATGAVLIIVGASSGGDSSSEQPSAPRVTARPARVGQTGYGLGVRGHF